MKHKIVLITGATSGIGKETALALAKQGATVVIIGRNETKTKATCDWLIKETNNHEIHSLIGDLSVVEEVRKVAQQFTNKYHHLDVLINNAGGFYVGPQITKDGFEKTWMTNYLSPVLLTELLLPKLQKSPAGRIVNVSSRLHRHGKIEFGNLNGEKKFSAQAAYGNSKLALIMYTQTLARRLAGSKVTVNSLHPGVVATGIWQSTGGPLKPLLGLTAKVLSQLGFILTSEQGAKTSIYLASAPDVAGVSGKYFVDCKETNSIEASYDKDLQQKLWSETKRVLKLEN